MFSCACLAVLSAEAQKDKPWWLDPEVNEVNTMAPRAAFFAYETENLAKADQKARSERYLSLEGKWKFNFSKDHDKAPRDFYSLKYDDSQWTDFPVPGILELNGYGDAIYSNNGYPWRTQFRPEPPFVEERNNYTGSYRKMVTVPADWKGERIYLHVGSATSNLMVWVNGKFVGYSEDSKVSAEFDLTKYLTPGKENLIAMQVMRWCDGSYLEDQDFWRFTGIAREVYLYARPQAHIADLFITPDLVNNYQDGTLEVKLNAVGAKGETVMFPLKDKEGKEVAAQTAKVGGNGEVKVNFDIKNPLKWTAETPNLYTLYTTLMDGKQVAILVPTTILALQHYQTILARMRGFPVKADMLSRFRSPKQMAESVRRLRRGETDIIVGTHRLLSSDVEFRDLGLVIIDEEQRFGVAHKEKLKQLSRNVDVLTLTATPIPRTLNMAMSGIRDMSVLEEAPGDRFPVQSYVLEYDDAVIGEAIRRELRRGGQVFYLHNRVETIFDTAARIRAMAPEARVVIAHGQTDREGLSDIWRAMVNNEADILVSTTIIETGVDIPNANTLIIERADCMGLSQLHQIRGRVGRSNRRAYAYFTYPRGYVLSEEAQKRLMAIREYTEFGSGFKVALRDLEIRGAGNLLGSEQHGHIDAVGYDMYMKLLNDAVLEEKGVPSEKKTAECTVDISVDAYIPEKYIAAASQRMDAYKKIASVQNRDDLRDVEEELRDRYGDLPVPVRDLLDISLLRSMGERCGIVRIEQKQNASPILRPAQTDPVIWTLLAGQFRGQLLLNLGAQPYVTCRLKKGEVALPFLLNLLTQYADLADARDAENAKNSEKTNNIHTENTNV